MKRSLSLIVAGSSTALFFLACSAEDGGPMLGGSTGGASGGSNTQSLGGSPTTTGGTSSGGTSSPATGGSATGGIPITGGQATTGGNLAGVGGSQSGGTGGDSSGQNAGGANAKGGTAGASSGGKSNTGGAPSSGGAGTAGMPAGQGGGAAMKSAGCGTATTQMLNSWVVQSNVMSGTTSRPYSVRLPTGYDPMRAYPVIVLLHGCTSGTNYVTMEKQTGTDAILIRGTGSAADTCWDTSATGQDVPFFDAMVADVKARFCTDTSRFFAVGYSSGSWLANQLGCIRANVLRGLGTVTGGNPGVRNCVGPIAQLFVHDKDDTTNVISGSESARDRLLTQNHCDKSITPVPEDPSPCVRYQGCDPGYPVVWCATSGQMHNRQDSFAGPAFWKFFKEF